MICLFCLDPSLPYRRGRARFCRKYFMIPVRLGRVGLICRDRGGVKRGIVFLTGYTFHIKQTGRFKQAFNQEKKMFISRLLGLVLMACSILFFINKVEIGGIIVLLIGSALVYLGFKPGGTGVIVFGHMCVLTGCILATWGFYLLPHSEPTVAGIFLQPLFWGFFSIFGGICAISHGFCRCVQRGNTD
jgi:hypothetical protein